MDLVRLIGERRMRIGSLIIDHVKLAQSCSIRWCRLSTNNYAIIETRFRSPVIRRAFSRYPSLFPPSMKQSKNTTPLGSPTQN